MMTVGGKHQRDPDQHQEVAQRRRLPALGGIDRFGEGEPQRLRHEVSRGLQAGHHQPRRDADHQPDQQFETQGREHRRAQPTAGQQGPRHGNQRQRQEQGEPQPHPRRDEAFADRRHQHDERADAREHQHEDGGNVRPDGNRHGGLVRPGTRPGRTPWRNSPAAY